MPANGSRAEPAQPDSTAVESGETDSSAVTERVSEVPREQVTSSAPGSENADEREVAPEPTTEASPELATSATPPVEHGVGTDVAPEVESTTENEEAGPAPVPVPPRQKRAGVSPPKRVTDLQRRSTAPLPAFPVDSPDSEDTLHPTGDDTRPESDDGDPTRATGSGDPRTDEAALVPDAERSAPKSAVAHVAIVEQEPHEATGRRARTLVPQLFAAAVIGFIAVAGAVGVLLPEQSGAPMSQTETETETVPNAPADSGPSITPAPTQTPELVIPSVPLDAGQGTGAAPGVDGEDEAGASGASSGSTTEAAGGGGSNGPSGGTPASGAIPGSPVTGRTETGGGTAPVVPGGTVPEEVPAPPPVPADPPTEDVDDGGEGEDGGVIGVVVDIVEEILP